MFKMNYKVGDKVRVREDLGLEHGAIPTMTRVWAGKDVTIGSVNATGYTIKEDPHPFKYSWGDEMFLGLSSEFTAPSNKMPKLETGMFGVEDDGDIFVVVNDILVYQSGMFADVNDVKEDGSFVTDGHIVALYDETCFTAVKDGRGELIWKRTESTERKEVKDSKEEKKSNKDEQFAREFMEFLTNIAMLESLTDDKGTKSA